MGSTSDRISGAANQAELFTMRARSAVAARDGELPARSIRVVRFARRCGPYGGRIQRCMD